MHEPNSTVIIVRNKNTNVNKDLTVKAKTKTKDLEKPYLILWLKM